MAHDLNYNEELGRHSMVSVKEVPWHGLGAVVDSAMTSKECIIESGLNFNVVKGPNHVHLPSTFSRPVSKTILNPNSFTTVREDTDTILGTVGKDYTVVQNSDAFAFFDEITKAKEAMFETAGALGNGEIIFITAKLPSYIKLDNGDAIENYLLLFNAHDGSKSVEVMFTPIRVVCSNTLSYARKTAQFTYRIRHTKSANSKLNNAAKVLGLKNTLIPSATAIYNKMAKFRLKDEQVDRYFARVFLNDSELASIDQGADVSEILSKNKRNTLNDVVNFYQTGQGQENILGTVWGAYNAVTGYHQHVKKYKDQEHKFVSITDRDVLNKNLKAFDYAFKILESV